MLLWALPILGGVVFLAVVGTIHRKAFAREWEELLSLSGAQHVRKLKDDLETDQMLARRALDKAKAADDRERAQALLARSADVVQGAIPGRVERLKAMSTWARMVAALTPVAPVQVRALRLTLTRWTAMAGRVLHYLAVSVEDRFVLKLSTLRWAYGALGFSARVVARDARVGRVEPKTWQAADDCVQDLGTLDGEQVKAAEQLMESLAATERDLHVAEERH
jgi:hypothetical protein